MAAIQVRDKLIIGGQNVAPEAIRFNRVRGQAQRFVQSLQVVSAPWQWRATHTLSRCPSIHRYDVPISITVYCFSIVARTPEMDR